MKQRRHRTLKNREDTYCMKGHSTIGGRNERNDSNGAVGWASKSHRTQPPSSSAGPRQDAGADEEIHLVGVGGVEEGKGRNTLLQCGVQVALVGPDISQRQAALKDPVPGARRVGECPHVTTGALGQPWICTYLSLPPLTFTHRFMPRLTGSEGSSSRTDGSAT